MNTRVIWTAQLLAASIIGGAGMLKILGNPGDELVFTALGMEPFGRYLIGVLELLAASLLLTGTFAASGALLAIGTMLGALIAHLTVLGPVVNADGGLHLIALFFVVFTSGPVLLARRRELPLIGVSF